MTNQQTWQERFDEKFEAVYDGTKLQIFRDDHLFPKVKFFIATLLEEQEEKHRADWNSTLEGLLFNGHGGGNFRRLIEQMRKPYID